MDPVDLILRRGRPGLIELMDGYAYSRQLGRSDWDFAVEVDTLLQRGLTRNDLRWLICSGHLVQRDELLSPPEIEAGEVRKFGELCGLTFGPQACCVLTEQGHQFVQEATSENRNGQTRPEVLQHSAPPVRSNGSRGLAPVWDRQRQELRVGSLLVKRYKVPAPNQELVLAVFEEEAWPPRVDDPLPPSPEMDPKRRLHDTINSLNRNQKNAMLRFAGDGSGRGILWSFTS